MYSSFLFTHRCIHVLHCSKQCYSSPTPRPFSSCAIFAFTSLTDGKWVPFSTLFTLGYRKRSQVAKSTNMEDVQVFKCVYREETSWPKGSCELGRCLDAVSRCYSSRDSAVSSARFVPLSLCYPHLVCNHSPTQTLLFVNNLTDFLNVLVGFQSQRVTWMLITFHFLPTLTKSFAPLKHTWTWH